MAKGDGTQKPSRPKNVSDYRAAGSNLVHITWSHGDNATSGKKKWTKKTKVVRSVYKADGSLHDTFTAHVDPDVLEYDHQIILSRWLPGDGKPAHGKIEYEVLSQNGAGYSSAAKGSFTPHVPAAPTGVTLEPDYSTGEVTARTTAENSDSNAGKGYRTRTDLIIERSRDGGAWERVASAFAGAEGGDLAASFNAGRDTNPTGWVAFRAAAWNSGPAGSSSATYSGDVCFSKPNTPAITGITASGDVATGIVAVSYNLNADYAHPVDRVTLQRLRGVSVDLDYEGAAASSGWQDVVSSDGNSAVLSDSRADSAPTEGGTRTWYRVKAEHGVFEAVYSRPETSDLMKMAVAPEPEPEPEAAVPVGVNLVRRRDDGTSVEIGIGWEGRADGIELSWSDDPDAWCSTGGPKTHEIDASGYPTGMTGMQYFVTELEEGVTYYLRARSWVDDGEGGRVYGGYYRKTITFTPLSRAPRPTVSAPVHVRRGEPIPVSWSITGERAQERYILRVMNPKVKENNGWRVVESASSAAESASVPASFYRGAGYVVVSVQVSTGGELSDEAEAKVMVADAPTFKFKDRVQMATRQPVPVAFECDRRDVSVSLSVVATGCSAGTTPDEPAQVYGDVLWGGTVNGSDLSWSGNAATAFLPDGLDLRQGINYLVRGYATTKDYGLQSVVDGQFVRPDWEHKAEAPTGRVSADGQGLECVVHVTAPKSAKDTDVIDLYRVTPDGELRIAKGVAAKPGAEAAIRDERAPYAGPTEDVELAYHAVMRTADGHTAGTYDLEYDLRWGATRLDWDGKSLDLAYNQRTTESWEKRFERAAYIDGTTGGDWGRGSERDMTLSAAIARPRSAKERGLISELARHDGPVLVRTPRGECFAANVQPSGVTYDYDSAAIEVELDIQEVDMPEGTAF